VICRRLSGSSSFCGFCYMNLVRGRNHCGHEGYVVDFDLLARAKMGKFLRKKADARGYSPLGPVAKGSAFAETYPCLFEYLTVTQWEDKTPRESSTLLLFVDDGRFKACLTDKDSGRYVFLTAGSVEALLNALEVGLVDDQLDWRKKTPFPGQGKNGRG